MKKIELIECPRDAMQGRHRFIPTQQKIEYINTLLQVGFDVLDFGSFVSPKAIPQMADTKEVLSKIDLGNTTTKLLAIVANVRGAEEAVQYDAIHYLGFPFSISQTFQQRNTNSTIEESVERIDAIQELCIKYNKTLVVYLSMGFGNPYGDEYNDGILLKWADEMAKRGIQIISLADTVGLATPDQISFALDTLIPQYPSVNFGVHLHTSFANRKDKLEAAIKSKCYRIDGALKGFGGCPMAQDDLVGNMDMEWLLQYLHQHKIEHASINQDALSKALMMTTDIFI